MRYILVKTDNKIFIKRKKNNIYFLEHPSCACDFSDPLDMEELLIIFERAFLNKALWNLIEEQLEESDNCDSCGVLKPLLKT